MCIQGDQGLPGVPGDIGFQGDKVIASFYPSGGFSTSVDNVCTYWLPAHIQAMLILKTWITPIIKTLYVVICMTRSDSPPLRAILLDRLKLKSLGENLLKMQFYKGQCGVFYGKCHNFLQNLNVWEQATQTRASVSRPVVTDSGNLSAEPQSSNALNCVHNFKHIASLIGFLMMLTAVGINAVHIHKCIAALGPVWL